MDVSILQHLKGRSVVVYGELVVGNRRIPKTFIIQNWDGVTTRGYVYDEKGRKFEFEAKSISDAQSYNNQEFPSMWSMFLISPSL